MTEFFQAKKLFLLLLLAVIVTAWWLWRQRKRLALCLPWIPVLSILHVVTGVACVMLFAVLEAWDISVLGSTSLFGAVFFLPLFYWLGAKLTHRSVAAVFDVFTVPMIFTLACARVNCLFAGCCLGAAIPGTDSRYPTREAELLFYAIMLAWLFWQTRKGNTAGKLYPSYMLAYGIFRFVCEFFRASAAHSLIDLSHIWALLCAVTGFSILTELRSREKKTNSKKHHQGGRKKNA